MAANANMSEEAINKALSLMLTNALIGTLSPACAGVREIMEQEVGYRLNPETKPEKHEWQVLDDSLWQTFKTLVSMREIGMIPTISL